MVGQGELEIDLKQYAKSFGVDQYVIWAGRKPHEEIPLWMSATDFLVLSSHSEGYGLVILEALACGTPVIATCVGGVPEILVSPALGMMVQPGDREALAHAMSEATNKSWDKNKLMAFVQTNTWAERTQHFLKVYQSVLKQKTSSKSK
jgi:glycosyltransferase involved in cell wall biosynthesis